MLARIGRGVSSLTLISAEVVPSLVRSGLVNGKGSFPRLVRYLQIVFADSAEDGTYSRIPI
jgi:hypothetical protein